MGGVLLGLGLLAGLQVTAEGTCPTAAAVEARLQQMLPQLHDLPPVRAHLEPIFDLLRIEVRSEDGALLSVRDLPRADRCADLAAAAAVAITSALLSAPRSPPLTPRTPPRPPAAPPVVRPPPAPPPAFDAGGAVALAAAGSGLTVGGTLVVHVAPHGRAGGVRLGLTATALRREALGDAGAGAAWTRAQLELGPRYRARLGRLLIDAHAHAAAALVYVAGQGFAADYQSWGWDAGLGGGVRAGLPLRWALPWVGVSATGYLRPQELLALGQPGSALLPRFEALFALGFSAGRWQ